MGTPRPKSSRPTGAEETATCPECGDTFIPDPSGREDRTGLNLGKPADYCGLACRLAADDDVATDGGEIVVAGDDAELIDGGDGEDAPGYTRDCEPPRQGGKKYVRCEGCGRELLVGLGGRDGILHREGCPDA